MKPQMKKKHTNIAAGAAGRSSQSPSGKKAGASAAAPAGAMTMNVSEGPINPNKTGGPS